MRVLITGGVGYVGSYLTSLLLGDDYKILSVDNLRRVDYQFVEK